MANSSCISEWKNKILSELQHDAEIITALGLNKGENADELVYCRLFPHYFIPDTQDEVKTYIMVEIDINSPRNRFDPSENIVYAYPVITFTVLAHQSDMRLFLPGISATRIDYIGELIDKKYNKRTGFGLGEIQLTSNVAGNLSDKYRFRQLTFQAIDFSSAPCEV